MKLCECGCGQPTAIAARSDPRHGYVKGQPSRFLRGHNARLGVPWWKGDQVSYYGLHRWLRTNYPKTHICDECGQYRERTEYALIHGREYSRNRDDYRELCKRCHNKYDGIASGGLAWKMGRVRQGPHGFERVT